MKKFTTSIIAVAALAATTISMAGGPDMSNQNLASNMGPTHRSGFYLNGGLGYGDITSSAVAGVTKDGFIYNAAAGYQFSPYLAVEAGYLELPVIKTTVSTTTVKDSSGLFNLLVKGMYPVTTNFDAFAKAGFGISRDSLNVNGVSTSDTNHYFVPMIGGGADYYLTDNVAVTGQVLYTFQNGSSANLKFPASVDGLLGITYKF